jgi:dTDP-4-dehydrorhamnose reductase
MILLLGASGYVGSAFASELRRRGHSFIPLTRRAFDYTRFDFLFDYLRTMKPAFLINAAAYSGHDASTQPDSLQQEREKMMAANAILPQMIARICMMTKTPWGHVSSGEIYSGAKVMRANGLETEKDLSVAEVRRQFDADPAAFRGFTELDEPNFSFRHTPSSFFSGSKALAEEAIRELGSIYIWRPRMLFNEKDEPCNYLRAVQQQPIVYDHVDSISHLADFVKAALDLWETRAPYGTYNMTNPGTVTTRQLAEDLHRAVKSNYPLTIAPPDQDPAGLDSEKPEAHCLLDVGKLQKAGVKIRPVQEALKDVLDRIRLTTRSYKTVEAQTTHLATAS